MNVVYGCGLKNSEQKVNPILCLTGHVPIETALGMFDQHTGSCSACSSQQPQDTLQPGSSVAFISPRGYLFTWEVFLSVLVQFHEIPVDLFLV